LTGSGGKRPCAVFKKKGGRETGKRIVGQNPDETFDKASD